MKKNLLFAFWIFFLSSTIVFAQTDEKKSDNKKETKSKNKQNQEEYLKPDMEQENFNYKDRKKVSPIQQPKYDQPNTPYQDSKFNKRKQQQQAFLDRKYYYPARPKDQWELGIHFGYFVLSGDVKPKHTPFNPIDNAGIGIHVRKAFNYIASIRVSYQFAQSKGRNWEPDQNIKHNKYLNGDMGGPDYYSNSALNAANTSAGLNMNGIFWHNYKVISHGLNIEGVFNIGNIRYHRERNIFNLYLYAGIATMLTKTTTDALDANGNEYDFSDIFKTYNDFHASGIGTDVNARKEIKKEMYKMLNEKFDGVYESRPDRDPNHTGFKDYELIFGATLGAGIQFHVSKWVTLGLDERIILTGNDNLDGYRFNQDYIGGFTREWDNFSYTSLQVLIHLGNKRLEPLYWLNPMDYAYRKVGESDPKAVADELMKDDDQDGVPNKMDKELDTPKDCPVDAKGVSLDSDKDGVKDCNDKEPFSPPGYPVDKDGVAIVPPNPCCDQSSKGSKGGAGGGFDCSKIDLPGIYFNDDKYYVSPEYYGNLHQIAERMQMCPDVKLVVTGNDASTANPKYNEQLAWNRVNQSVDYLVNKYGISRDRFIVNFKGTKKPTTAQSEFEKLKSRGVEFRYSNEGETGSSNPPAPHPGLKAGSDK